MKNYFKFILAVIIFKSSILLSQRINAKHKENFVCNEADGKCFILPDGNTRIGAYQEITI